MSLGYLHPQVGYCVNCSSTSAAIFLRCDIRQPSFLLKGHDEVKHSEEGDHKPIRSSDTLRARHPGEGENSGGGAGGHNPDRHARHHDEVKYSDGNHKPIRSSYTLRARHLDEGEHSGGEGHKDTKRHCKSFFFLSLVSY